MEEETRTDGGSDHWLVALFASKTRLWIARILFVVLGVGGFVGGCGPYLLPEIYLDGMRERAEPLLVAIEHYLRDKGEPPAVLPDLVPEYIEELPKTGYLPQGKFGYATGRAYAARGQTAGDVYWHVWVNCGVFDMFADHDFTYEPTTKTWSGPNRRSPNVYRWPWRQDNPRSWRGIMMLIAMATTCVVVLGLVVEVLLGDALRRARV